MAEHKANQVTHKEHHEARKRKHAEMMARAAERHEKYKKVSRDLIREAKATEHTVNPVLPERDDPLIRQDIYF